MCSDEKNRGTRRWRTFFGCGLGVWRKVQGVSILYFFFVVFVFYFVTQRTCELMVMHLPGPWRGGGRPGVYLIFRHQIWMGFARTLQSIERMLAWLKVAINFSHCFVRLSTAIRLCPNKNIPINHPEANEGGWAFHRVVYFLTLPESGQTIRVL